MLNDIKKILGINNTQFDTILQMLIDAGKKDLIEAGIVSTKVVESDALIYSALISYVCGMFDTYEYRELSMNTYRLQKDQLRHHIDYIGG